jgi:hypothetical protein
VADSLVTTDSQNLLFASVNGAIPVGSTLYVRPVVDFRLQSFGTPPGEVDLGGNWILGGGCGRRTVHASDARVGRFFF